MKKINTTTVSAMTTNSGKTTFTLGLLSLLQKRGNICSFKVGPDFIDPMFHSVVLNQNRVKADVQSATYNLDSFFETEKALKQRFSKAAQNTDFAIIEGVMGHLDGLKAGKASTDEVAAFTQTPVTLLVEEKPSIRTLAAMIDGVIKNSQSTINAIIITKSKSERLFQMQKKEIELLTGTAVAGRLPYDEALQIPSRHLGLNTDMIRLKDELLTIAENCSQLISDNVDLKKISHQMNLTRTEQTLNETKKTKIAAISRDEAFCFMYRANLEWLETMGYKIVYFSPMRDKQFPQADFYYLCGGYPEIYLDELSKNKTMLKAIKEVCASSIPVLAECGGFMYLHESIEGKPMVGFLKGEAKIGTRMNRRFGYERITLQDPFIFDSNQLRGHEFHYGYIENGSEEAGITIEKASNAIAFKSGHYKNNTLGSFSHLYFQSQGNENLQG